LKFQYKAPERLNIKTPRQTVRGERRKLHNEELHNLYSSTINKLIACSNQSGREGRTGTSYGKIRNATSILILIPEASRTLTDQDVDRWISLKWILK
jgi:hypothetical protein